MFNGGSRDLKVSTFILPLNDLLLLDITSSGVSLVANSSGTTPQTVLKEVLSTG